MQNVLADLAIESEAATIAALRLARAYDEAIAGDEQAHAFKRIANAVLKYWICKRGAVHAVEALECLGGNGYVEESGMPRLYREAPLNSIWEGSGNVQCLDVLRAMVREPGVARGLLRRGRRGAPAPSRASTRRAAELRDELADLEAIESRARRVVERMALALQGSLLVRYGDEAVADAFCASRLGGDWGHAFGTLPAGHRLRAHHRAPRGVHLAVKPSERIRHHLQSHVVAYLALFVALSGTALALPGKNKRQVERHRPQRGQGQGDRRPRGRQGEAPRRGGQLVDRRRRVISAPLADGAVTAPKLAEDSVTRGKIVEGSINGGKIANGAIDSAKVDDGSLLGEDFAPGQLSDGFATRGFAQPVGQAEVDQRLHHRATGQAVRYRHAVRVVSAGEPDAVRRQLLRPGAGRSGTGHPEQRVATRRHVRAADPGRALRSGPRGALNISLREVDGDATEAQVTLAGVLIQ